jgi:cytochrome c553
MRATPLLVCAWAIWPGIAYADMINTEGMEPWEHCAECHDMSGVSPVPRFPHLAGQRRSYIVKQASEFRARARSNSRGQMDAVTSELSDEDIDRIAVYFSGLPPPAPRTAELSAADHAAAQSLFERGRAADRTPSCLSCHGKANAERPTPALEAQHAGYLAKQLRDFRDGARANDLEGEMRAVARGLPDAEIDRLALYIAGLPRPDIRP